MVQAADVADVALIGRNSYSDGMVSRLTAKGQLTIPKPLRDSLGLEPGHELEFEEREGALIVRRRAPVDPLRRLVGLLPRHIDVDAYLEETRGPAWQPDLDGGEGCSS